MNGLFIGNVLHEFIAMEDDFIDILLLGHNLFGDDMQLFHLSKEFFLEDGQDLVLGQILVRFLHPGQKVFVGHDKCTETSHGILE